MVSISVIIPSFRPEEYISKCLESLKSQKIESKEFEFEIIIILNGERLPFFDYIKSLVKGYDNFKVYYNEEEGVSNARNRGLYLAKGEYIVFIDDDDYVSSTYLVDLFNSVVNPSDIVVSNFYSSNEGVLASDYISSTYEKNIGKKFDIINFRGFLSSVTGKMIPRSVIKETRFIKELKISEDAIFMFELSKDIQNMRLAPDTCIYYRRVRDGSALRKKQSVLKNFKIMFTSILGFTRIYLKNPLKYNLLFYLTRVFAAIKVFLLRIRNKI